MKRSALIPLFLLSSACGAPPNDSAEASASADTAIAWEAAIRCDGAVLDVNANERRDVQFVIRDAQAIDSLTHSADLPSVAPGTINAAGEFILSGHVSRGIFHTADFASAQVKNGTSVFGFVTVAGNNAGAPGAGGGGDPSDLLIWFGEYTNWRFRSCGGQL